jgi:drug/metabolite transporter (DMT)-like permease
VQVIAGEWLQAEASGSKNITLASLVVGAGLALLGTVAFSVAMVLVEATAHKLSNNEIMAAFFAPMIAVSLVLALAVEGTDWSWLTSLDASGWGVLLFASLVSSAASTLLLNVGIRHVGANSAAVLAPLALVASIIGELVLPPHVLVICGLAIAGVVLIMVAVSGFFALQVWLSSQQQAQRAEDAVTQPACS